MIILIKSLLSLSLLFCDISSEHEKELLSTEKESITCVMRTEQLNSGVDL